jgi:hypothetical protein
MQNRGGIGNRDKLVSKPILLGLTTAIIIGVLTPLVIPHISHPSMIYHIILHLAGLTIASFLGLVSYLAYKRVGGSRILLMTVGFMALSSAEILYFLDANGASSHCKHRAASRDPFGNDYPVWSWSIEE